VGSGFSGSGLPRQAERVLCQCEAFECGSERVLGQVRQGGFEQIEGVLILIGGQQCPGSGAGDGGGLSDGVLGKTGVGERQGLFDVADANQGVSDQGGPFQVVVQTLRDLLEGCVYLNPVLAVTDVLAGGLQ
jgi:hypothetical protein